MAIALFTKLSKVKYDKVPFFSTMINHEKSSQDGYRVLYAFLSCCHPKLVQQTKLNTPALAENGNLFTFTQMYKNWLEYEKILNCHYSDLENLSAFIHALEKDGQFSKALSTIYMQKQLYEQMLPLNANTQFPQALTIDIIPYTVMHEYNSKDKRDLFGEDINEESTSSPTINRLNNVQNLYNKNRGNNL